MVDAPAVEALTFRYFSGDADLPILTEIIKLDMAANQTSMVLGADEIAFMFSPNERYDPYSQLVIAEVDGAAVAYATFRNTVLPDGSHIDRLEGAVIPVWRRHGLGRTLLRYTEDRCRRLASRQESNESWLFQTGCPDTAVGTLALLQQEGYRPVRYFHEMVRPHLEEIPDAPLPPGVEVRPVQPEHYRSIWDAHQENFAEAWGRAVPSADDYERWLSWPLFEPSLWCIAWADDEVVGQVRSFIVEDENKVLGRLRGYTESISVRRDWRRQGLAKALLCQSLHAIKNVGMTEAALGVDTENPHQALQLYASCGFLVEERYIAYRKPMTP